MVYNLDVLLTFDPDHKPHKKDLEAVAREEIRERSLYLNTHLNQWQELTERLTQSILPALEMREALQRSVQPMIDIQNTIQNALEPVIAQQESLQNLLERVVASVFDAVQTTFQELPPRVQEAIIMLGKQGWYWDSVIPYPVLWQLEALLIEGAVAEVEDSLVEHFENRLSEIEKSILEEFPHRGHLVRAAFGAHRRKEYELSIPVFFAQTDGIYKEVANEYLFMKKNNAPGTATYVEQISADSFTVALLGPLTQTLPINASVKDRPEGFHMLNRHTVLHGESLDYGSKINSLKAISLINYVVYVLRSREDSQ